MKCKVCDYRLWNLSSRTCPECGTPFRPSEYTFSPNTVAFCCPHCDQSYYGRDAQGHLLPRQFACVTCGEAVDMDAMVLRPASDLDEQQTLPERNPWVERSDGSPVMAWLATIGAAIGRPGRLLRVTPRDSTGPAWSFALITLLITTLASASGMCVVLFVPMMLAGPPGRWSDALLPITFMVIGQLAVTLGLLALWGLVTHGLLRLGGSPAAGIGRTYQALCYTHGVTIISAVPCLSTYIVLPAWLWWVISAVFAVKEAQQVSGGRAAMAVLTLPAVVAATVTGLVVWMVVMIFVTINSISSIHTAGLGMLQIHAGLQHAAGQQGGQPPDHVGELLLQQAMSPYDFIDWGVSGTSLHDVPIGQHNLGNWDLLSPADQRAAVADATAALPPNGEPYRFGDYVFTYRGLDFQQHPGHLWVAIHHPDPAHNAAPSQIGVLLLDGSTADFPQTTFAPALHQQNTERAAVGLPPIPDPGTIRHPPSGP